MRWQLKSAKFMNHEYELHNKNTSIRPALAAVSEYKAAALRNRNAERVPRSRSTWRATTFSNILLYLLQKHFLIPKT